MAYGAASGSTLEFTVLSTLFALVLLYYRDRIPGLSPSPRDSIPGILIVAASLAISPLKSMIYPGASPIGAVNFYVGSMGILVSVLGWSRIREYYPILIPMAVILSARPLVYTALRGWIIRDVSPLSARIAVSLYSAFGGTAEIVRDGVTMIETPSGSVVIDSGCAGIVGSIFFLAFFPPIAHASSAPQKAKIILTSLGPPTWFLLNGARISILLWTLSRWGYGTMLRVHHYLGLALFIVLLFSFSAILERLERGA